MDYLNTEDLDCIAYIDNAVLGMPPQKPQVLSYLGNKL